MEGKRQGASLRYSYHEAIWLPRAKKRRKLLVPDFCRASLLLPSYQTTLAFKKEKTPRSLNQFCLRLESLVIFRGKKNLGNKSPEF